jgi:hypothetical protein
MDRLDELQATLRLLGDKNVVADICTLIDFQLEASIRSYDGAKDINAFMATQGARGALKVLKQKMNLTPSQVATSLKNHKENTRADT